MAYSIVISGIDRTADVIAGSVTIDDVINDQLNTCSFTLIDRSGNGIPKPDEQITIRLDDGTKIFGGYTTSFKMSTLSSGVVMANYECGDYSRLLDSVLVHRTYKNMTDTNIIKDIVNRYLGGYGITYTNVIGSATIDQIAFNYVQPTQAIRRLAELTSHYWYIDYDRDLHYFPLTTEPAPFDIDVTNNQYINLDIGNDNSQMKNRIFVRGGTKLSDPVSYSEKGDGEKRIFLLPDKPHNVTVKVNTVAESMGIKNLDLTGYDWYLNFQEKYLEQDAGGTVLGAGDTLEVTYQYDMPILIAQENTASVEEFGVSEFAIFDESITTTKSARARAVAELNDYSQTLIEGTFKTYTTGFRSGQYIHINLPAYDIDADYIVQRVNCQSFSNGNFEYTISVASAKIIGMVRFLIDLLEADRLVVKVTDDEVIDELAELADSISLPTESLTDFTTDGSAEWSIDLAQVAPNTHARWDLFEWNA